ncbi:marine proteobacterial sortase target protein [Bacteroidia bacterium]|nr:marine proteobacterial sortase target protein [Bacteroidia bacterium]
MSTNETIVSDFEKLSLKKIDVTGNVLGKFSTFMIQQEYANNTNAVLEVTYTFPISATATVTGFTATIGDKIIKGKVKEKEEAKKEYQKAMLRGDSAYMMTNDESNIFRMNIGKIAVGETVIVKIDYIDNFDIVDNQIRMIVPTLVPPRYKSNITNRLFYRKNEIEYRGNVIIHFDKDLKINDIESKTHSIKLENNTVSAKNIKLDRDFVLDIKLAEQAFSKGYYKELPNGKKVVYLSFFPDIEIEQKHTPKDYVFVIDISGSMTGFKLEQTKGAVLKCLKQLNPNDRFNVIVFDHECEFFRNTLVEFNSDNYEEAKRYIQLLCARGGTELFKPLQKAIQMFGKEKIIFLFTDGQVGNESQIAGWIRQNIGKNTLFIFGIDSSVNKKGLQDIAEAGRGKVEFIVKDEMIKDVVLRQFSRVSAANLFEIKIDCKTNKTGDKIEKSRVLFNHEFYDVLVEIDDIADDFELVCKTDDKTFSFAIPKNALEHSELPLDKIYASEQIKRAEKYIEVRRYDDSKGYKEQIVEIAVQYQIDSKYTAFIAVNERDEKLTDIPELQDTVLESPMEWDIVHQKRTVSAKVSAKVPAKSAGFFNNINIMMDNLFAVSETDYLFEMIKSCEEIITNNGDYKDLLDEIIEELKPDFSSPKKEYKALFKKMKKKTPKVYALIEPFLK